MERYKTIVIKDTSGFPLFAWTAKDNTIGETLQEGIARHISFDRADLRDADLRDADLSDGNFQRACFRGAMLRNTKMDKCDLRWTDLNDITF